MEKARNRIERLESELVGSVQPVNLLPQSTGNKNDNDQSKNEEYADEYGDMDSSGETFIVDKFVLESGVVLEKAPVRFNTWGKLNSLKDNVLVVCHALTGNARLDTWWGDLLGESKAFDTSKYFVICLNILGSCYGTAGPLELNPKTNKPYGADFPLVTVRDTVKIHAHVLSKVYGIEKVFAVIGGSLGGMQALEWAFMGLTKSAVPMACGGRHHPWQIAISEVQRQAIYQDKNWNNGYFSPDKPPTSGLALARAIGMISYRTHSSFGTKFGRKTQPNQPSIFTVQSYLNYQGEKFIGRFNANSYISITKMLDSHDVSNGRGEYFETLKSLKVPILVIGIDSDVLYPISEQKELADYIPNSKLVVVTSLEGHDGFLLEQTQISKAIIEFLSSLQ